jgi:carboxylesterase type B
LRLTLPEFGEEDLDKVLRYYPDSNASAFSQPKQFTTNVSGLSSLAAEQQQRANVWPHLPGCFHACLLTRMQNIYAELTFVCPSYWLAEAYSSQGRRAYKYAFNVQPGTHASDLHGYLGPLGGVPYLSADVQRAFMMMWGRFVTEEQPSIPHAVAAGTGTDAAAQWPAFSAPQPYQLNIDQTGGKPAVAAMGVYSPVDTPYFTEPGLEPDFSLVNAYTWEYERGTRCDFWRSLAAIIPA